MTAPTPTNPHFPTFYIDGLTIGDGYGHVDDLGRHWWLEKETGWSTVAANRTERSDRPSSHGTYNSLRLRAGKVITLRGTVHFDDDALREPTLLELAALCSDGARTYPMRRTAGPEHDHVREVALEGQPQVDDYANRWYIDFELDFYTDDPRKHAYAWQRPFSTPASGGVNGLNYGTDGLGYSGGGLDYGSQPVTFVTAQVGNYGTAPASPVFEIAGPITQPVIYDVDSGLSISYAANIAAGETLSINCDEFPAMNLLAHACISSRRGNVRSMLTIGTEWPVVQPQTVARYQLRGLGNETSQLRVNLRSAWW